MRLGTCLLALAIWIPSRAVDAAAQTSPCQQQIATVTVPSESYAEITASDFARRLYLYVPGITADGATGFRPFQLWVVEGVYSQPFVRPAGRFTSAAFTRLRQSRNLRTTAVSVSRGNGADRGTFSFRRNSYQVQVVQVTVGRTPSVRVRVCR